MSTLATVLRQLTFALIVGISSNSLAGQITPDSVRKTVSISDASRALVLRLAYGERCLLDSVRVHGREVVEPGSGVSSGIYMGGKWFTTRSGIRTPHVAVNDNRVLITGIHISAQDVDETWTFTAQRDEIQWRIDRTYRSRLRLDDTAQPSWTFAHMTTWAGALLGTGGVAWCKLFDAANASYGIHTDSAAFWNAGHDDCLEIRSTGPTSSAAMRFSREPSGAFTLSSEPTRVELKPRAGQIRFDRNHQEIWAPFEASGTQSVTYHLRAKRYSKAMDRGTLKGLDGNSVREIMNTIGRIGVIDTGIMGSNGWYSGYAVLHEPWIALMGLAVDDPPYTRNMARALDQQRDFALQPDGMVKSRWAYGNWDARPGTYDEHGFYECQWGRLMDTQPSYVINVAEQFDQSGDLAWARGHKKSCEAALGYLLRRDTNGNGLVEMETDSRADHKASDWLDVIWASFENAFVNAQMYRALTAWSDVEVLLGDTAKSNDYRIRASKLKRAFNNPISKGGFWDPEKRWYVYWRDRDGSVHGNNLTLPVNFMAIAYGICDDPARSRSILEQVEAAMIKEDLFCWPANIFTFLPGETDRSDFPNYENGDIFLAWAEAGIRAYARVDPAIAVKYVRRVLDRYGKDGLAFQRYLRKDQSGAGDDILANNCSAVVGLYRNIYGIQPKHNRLYLEPHLIPQLNGTVVKYGLRGRRYDISLSTGKFSTKSGGWNLESLGPFGSNFARDSMEYFHADADSPSLLIHARTPMDVSIISWQGARKWIVRAVRSSAANFTVCGLAPHAVYCVQIGKRFETLRTDASGRLVCSAAVPARSSLACSISAYVHAMASPGHSKC